MIKYTMKSGSAIIVGLGLSEGNIKRLREKKPILVKLQDLGITEPIEILIHWGETEHALTAEIVQNFGAPHIVHHFDEKENQK